MNKPRFSGNLWHLTIQNMLHLGAALNRKFPSIFPMRLARAIFRLLSPKQELLTYYGENMILQCYKSHWAAYCMGSYEPVTRGVMESLFKPGMIFVDGGANIGLYSVLASKIVGPQGEVYAFEPHPLIYRVLASNLSANHVSNVKAWNTGLGATRGTAWLHHASEPGSHTLMESESTDGFLVQITPLDEIVSDGRVDLIKLDLEGGEPFALRGMKGLLAREKKPIIIMEFCSDWLVRSKTSPLDVTGFLERHGFRILAIDDRNRRGPFDLDDHQKRVLEGHQFNYNLYCIPDRWSYEY